MIDVNNVILKSEEEIDLEIYNDKIQALLFTIEGTLPGSRGFGIPMRALSKPQAIAANTMVAELAAKVDTFIPEVRVVGATTTGTIDGDLDITLQIGRRT